MVVRKNCRCKTSFFNLKRRETLCPPIGVGNLFRDSKGVAVTEMLPLLSLFIILFGLTFGFWGTIHSGSLRSIAARHYAFEVINNRTHFIYHRDTISPSPSDDYYKNPGYRYFAVVDRQVGDNSELYTTPSKINLFDQGILEVNSTNRTNQSPGDKVNPIWLKQGYGICINYDSCKHLR